MAYNTGRTGWNTRGGTDREHLLIHARIVQEERLFELGKLCARLYGLIGPENYSAWVDANLNDSDTFAQAIEKIQAAIDAHDECSCMLPEQNCPSCRKAATAHLAPDEIPYEER